MLDEFRSTSITWDKATRRIYSPITANASDSNGRKLNIQVVNSGQVENLTGATLHLYWETKDKAQHGLDAFTASDISKGEFEIFYTTGMLSNVGELNATLVLVDSTGKVVSDWFKITVTRGINEGAIESENSFSSLTQALIDISNLEQNYAPRLNDLTAQLQHIEADYNAAAANLTIDSEVILARDGNDSLNARLNKVDDLIYGSRNLFDKDSIISDSVILSDGTIATNTSYLRTDFIYVGDNDFISMHSKNFDGYGFNFIALYDENKQFTFRAAGPSMSNKFGKNNVAVKYIILIGEKSFINGFDVMVNVGEILLPYEPYGAVYVDKSEYAPYTPETIDDKKLILPDDIYLVDDEPLRVYKQSLFADYRNTDTIRVLAKNHLTPNNPYEAYFGDYLDIDSADLFAPTLQLLMTDDSHLGTFYGKTLNVNKCAKTAITNVAPTVIMFGDSTTAMGLPTRVYRKLLGYGMTPNFAGTIKQGDFWINDIKHTIYMEGRSSYHFAQYIGLMSWGNDSNTLIDLLPFLKLANADDKANHPDWCFTRVGSLTEQSYTTATDKNQDFYIFDFAYYLQNNSLPTPDCITIQMGTNDIAKFGLTSGLDRSKLAIKIMLSQIQTACPNAKIAVAPLPQRGANDFDEYISMSVPFREQFVAYVKSIKTSNVNIVFEHLSQSPETSFGIVDSTINVNGMDKFTIVDGVHTDQAGFTDGGNVFAQWIANKCV